MSPDSPITGWHSTDDEVLIPVRSSASEQTKNPTAGPSLDMTTGMTDHLILRHPAAAAANQSSMRLSAFLGVILVLGAIGFHFGFSNIFGDLTNGSDAATTVEITTEGVFSPNKITLHPGDKLTLSNKNKDPQVIKSKDGQELFPVQVLFEKAFEFTVPAEAKGTFTYFSETLPDDKTLVITVSAMTQGATSSVTQEVIDIPLPFGDGNSVTVTSENTASSTSSAPAVLIQKTEHLGETATISLSGNNEFSSDDVPEDSFSGQIPTNPYTVNTGLKEQGRLEEIAAAAKEAQNLHSGAPLDQMMKHKPKTVTQTGPEGVLLFIFPAFFGVVLLYRKLSII